jgi:hypothetical protein
MRAWYFSVQNILYLCLLSENIKTETKNTKIVPVFIGPITGKNKSPSWRKGFWQEHLDLRHKQCNKDTMKEVIICTLHEIILG